MSAYTDRMVAEMNKIGSFNYETATAFAQAHNLSARSVISKVKNLDLEYIAKPKAASKSGDRIRKIDIVRTIANSLHADSEKLEGLAKADANALNALLAAINS